MLTSFTRYLSTYCCFVTTLLYFDILFLPPATKVLGKVMFLHLSDSHSVHGGSASLHAGIPHQTRHPPDQAPPMDKAPPNQAPPRTMHRPSAEHAGRYGQRVGGTHPTEYNLVKRMFINSNDQCESV